MKRVILHIDMNSYFASVEQQARPALRQKPVGIVGSPDKKRTIIVTASYEAKALGVKTGTQLWEAKKLCPNIELISADCQRYEAITRQFLNIFISKTPMVEIFSIDEAFLDISSQLSTCSDQASAFEQAKKIAREIKLEIKKKIGENVRCSIGIGQNKFIAKLAGESQKPDGLTVVLPGEEETFVDKFELMDACGIGFQINAHLKRLGIETFKDLRNRPLTDLTLIFKSYGLVLYRMSRGQDFDKIKPYFQRDLPKSFSRSKTLRHDIFDKEILKNCLLAFCTDIAKELKSKNLLAQNIGIYLRFKDFSGYHQTQNIKRQTNLGLDLYKTLETLIDKVELKKPVRKIGIWAGALQKDCKKQMLFAEMEKPGILERLAEKINEKHGRDLVRRGRLARFDFYGKTPNYGFKKDYQI